jgi:hypothetical protein
MRNIRKLLAGLLSIPLGCAMLHAAAFTSDFNSGLPAGSVVGGNSVVDAGVMKLTQAANNQQGIYFINNFNGGNSVTNFKAHFKLALGGGTCCGDRMADGISFVFSPDINASTSYGEEGFGNGIVVGFDTWDNAAGDTAPAIELKVGGTQVAFQSLNGVREGGLPPAGPLLTNSLGEPVGIFTFGPDPATPVYVNVDFELFADNTFSLSYSNVVVWDHLPIPYVPIVGGNFGFGGRTGGANEAAFIDDIAILANYTAGPVTITAEPSDVTVTESQTATFSLGVDGTPPYNIQWYSNGVAIAGANGTSYTTPATTLSMNNALYRADASGPLSPSPVSTRSAKLTVQAGTLVQKVTTLGQLDKVVVTFNKPVNLNGTYTLDNGATVNSKAYGSSQNVVVLSTTTLTIDGTYNLAISAVTGQDTSILVPDPTVITFHEGFGSFCTDFAAGVPAGTLISGSAAVTDGILHLTDDGAAGACGAFYISNQTGGAVLDRLRARWKSRVGGPLSGNADGYSFNWANDLPQNCGGAEEGAGTGLSLTLDTWDNGAGPDTGIEIKWHGARLAFAHIERNGTGADNYIAKDTFVDAEVSVEPDGRVTFTYDGNTVSATVPGWTGIANGSFLFGARTGGETDNMWIDDLCINNWTLGPVSIVQQPVDTTALEIERATFSVGVDGSPSYTYQWFTNGVAVSGATGSKFITQPTTAAMEGTVVTVKINNDFSTVTSSAATLHVKVNPRVVSVFSRFDNEVHVTYTANVALGDTDPEVAYNLDNGIFEATRSYGADHKEVIIYTDSPLVNNTVYTLTIQKVAAEADSTLLILPNPSIRQFHHGFGGFCTDFTGLTTPPAGMTISGSAALPGDGFLHLTEEIGSQAGTAIIADPNSGFAIDRLQVSYRARVGSAGTPADGYSFNWANNLPDSGIGEEGVGNGLTVAFDSFDNGGGEAPAFTLKWNGATVAEVKNRAMISGNNFVDVFMNMDPDGKFDLVYDNQVIFSKQPTPFTPRTGARFGFGARTGGLTERAYIDDLKINCFPLGLGNFTKQPSDVTVQENQFQTVRFVAGFDALPPYTMQWYSNNVAIAGATSYTYTTPVLNRSANGATYYLVLTTSAGPVTSRLAQVTVVADNTAPTLVSDARACNPAAILVSFSEDLDATSANNAANYTIDNGATVVAASLQNNKRSVLLFVNPPLQDGTVYHLTVNGVKDAIGLNAASGSGMISRKGPIQATGPQNLVVIEAEDYDLVYNLANVGWVFANSLPGYVGTGYMDGTPNIGFSGGDSPATFTNAPSLHYCINFPAAGRYFMWGRGSTANDGGNNSYHFAIDQVSPNEFTRRVGNRISNWGGDAANVNNFGWVNDVNGTGATSVAYIDIASSGLHMLSIYMREDGIKLDRFVMTTDSTFTLGVSDLGPTASARTAINPPVNLVKASNGDITLSWTGNGWTLQATGSLTPPVTWTDVSTSSPATISAAGAGSARYFRLIGR